MVIFFWNLTWSLISIKVNRCSPDGPRITSRLIVGRGIDHRVTWTFIASTEGRSARILWNCSWQQVRQPNQNICAKQSIDDVKDVYFLCTIYVLVNLEWDGLIQNFRFLILQYFRSVKLYHCWIKLILDNTNLHWGLKMCVLSREQTSIYREFISSGVRIIVRLM